MTRKTSTQIYCTMKNCELTYDLFPQERFTVDFIVTIVAL